MAMSVKAQQEMQDAVIKALGHPIRRQILRRLENVNNGGLSPSMLAEEFGTQLANLSYHVRELEGLGVIKLQNTKPRRGAIEHFYKRAGNALDKKVAEVQNLVEQKK